MAIDLYEREVKVIMENGGGTERLKNQYMILSKHLDIISDENKELKKQISELESKLETAENAFNHIRDCSKRQFDKNEKLEKEIEIRNTEIASLEDKEYEQKQIIAKLESELAVKEDLLKIKNAYSDKDWEKDLKAMVDFGIHIDEETLKKFAELGKEGEILEEPLPFSDEQYEEEKIDKIEKAVSGIQGFLKKETEQKIKKLEEEQARLMYESAYYRFLGEAISPLKPTSEVHRMKGL